MKHLLIITLIAITASAQEKQKEPLGPRVSKMVQLQHLTGADFTHAIQMMRMFGVSIEGDSGMKAVAVSGDKAGVEAVEEALKRLDVPPPTRPANKNVEVTLHVVLGSNKSTDSKLIPDVEPVIKQMRGLFLFHSYQILDTMLIRTRENRELRGDPTRFGGRLQVDSPGTMTCGGQLYASSSEDTKPRTFRLDRFSFKCGENMVNIYTDVDLREGQKAVVGKSSLDANSAVFLIVSAKQVE